jgi:predicted ATPase
MNETEKALVDTHIAIKIIRPIGDAIRAEECDADALHVAADECRMLAEASAEGRLNIQAEELSKEEKIALEIARVTADVGGSLEALAESNNEHLLDELRGMKNRIDNIIDEVEHG